MDEAKRRSFLGGLLSGLLAVPMVIWQACEAAAQVDDNKKHGPKVPRKYGIARPEEKKKRKKPDGDDKAPK